MVNLNIRAKIIIGLLSVFAIMFSVAIFLLMQLHSIGIQTKLLYEHPYYVSNTTRELKADIFKISLLISDIQFAENKHQIDSLRKEVVLCNANIANCFNIINTYYLGNKKDVDSAFAAYSVWKTNYNQYELQQDNLSDSIQSLIRTNSRIHLKEVLIHLNAISIFAKNKADDTFLKVITAENRSKLFSIILLGGSVLFVLFLIIYLSQVIAYPIRTFISQANLLLKKEGKAKSIGDEKILISTLDELKDAFGNIERQNREIEKKNIQLALLNQGLEEKVEQRTIELTFANKNLSFQIEEKEKRALELITINKELEQFAHANKELKQFAYIASHELKEPLRTIENYIQIINDDYSGKLDEKAIEYLRIIDNSAKRMTILINSLLQFSRLGINKKLCNVDCKEIVDSVISDLAVIINSSNTTIEVSEMPKLNVYEIEFRQIFQNLIMNAIEYQKKGSRPKIQIRSEKINENYRFSVSDNGIGIDPTHFDRVFDIFQRLHVTEDVFKGKGVGLAYCKKIVQLHQGEIWIEPNKGEGVTFFFTIPILIV